MLIGISNLSWSTEQDAKYLKIAKESGFDYVEAPYSRIVGESSLLKVKAIQSVFYGSGIDSFEDERCLGHMSKVLLDCKVQGVDVITFGSPGMRVGSKQLMIDFLYAVDELLDDSKTKLCIEPNAKYYGAEYYNTLEEIATDLALFKNIGSMIDVGNSLLEDGKYLQEYEKYKNFVSHVHFSTPGLNEISDFGLYREFYKTLADSNYNGYISYEFLNASNVEDAIKKFSLNVIGD